MGPKSVGSKGFFWKLWGRKAKISSWMLHKDNAWSSAAGAWYSGHGHKGRVFGLWSFQRLLKGVVGSDFAISNHPTAKLFFQTFRSDFSYIYVWSSAAGAWYSGHGPTKHQVFQSVWYGKDYIHFGAEKPTARIFSQGICDSWRISMHEVRISMHEVRQQGCGIRAMVLPKTKFPNPFDTAMISPILGPKNPRRGFFSRLFAISGVKHHFRTQSENTFL